MGCFGISHGSYVVTHIKSVGGTNDYDLAMVIGGRGTVNEPWKVKSTISCLEYTVSAMEIAKDSYSLNYSIEDARVIYKAITNKTLDKPKPPEQTSAYPF